MSKITEKTWQQGEQLLEIAKKDREKLEPRLKPAVIDGLEADLRQLAQDSVEAINARQAKNAATLSQEQAARQLFECVASVRRALKLNRADPVVLRRAGVGKSIDVSIVHSVIEGAALLQAAYAEFPDAVRQVGVLPADMEQIHALMNRLQTVDASQERSKLTSKSKTQQRNDTLRRVKNAMRAIIGAAELAFPHDAACLALYRSLLPAGRNRPKNAATPDSPSV